MAKVHGVANLTHLFLALAGLMPSLRIFFQILSTTLATASAYMGITTTCWQAAIRRGNDAHLHINTITKEAEYRCATALYSFIVLWVFPDIS